MHACRFVVTVLSSWSCGLGRGFNPFVWGVAALQWLSNLLVSAVATSSSSEPAPQLRRRKPQLVSCSKTCLACCARDACVGLLVSFLCRSKRVGKLGGV
eukprot:3412449-Amphidinium_carterae.1